MVRQEGIDRFFEGLIAGFAAIEVEALIFATKTITTTTAAALAASGSSLMMPNFVWLLIFIDLAGGFISGITSISFGAGFLLGDGLVLKFSGSSLWNIDHGIVWGLVGVAIATSIGMALRGYILYSRPQS